MLLEALANVRSELLELRKMNWKSLNLADFTAKK
jgi:hypothetical protein